MGKKRSKLEITKDILDTLKVNRKAKITHLIYKANLSNNIIKEYLQELLKNGLVNVIEENGKKFFVITARGMDFLNEYKKIKVFTDAYGLDY